MSISDQTPLAAAETERKIADYALEVLSVLPLLIQAGINIGEFIASQIAKLKAMREESRVPTDEEWEALNSYIESLRKQLHGGEIPGSG